MAKHKPLSADEAEALFATVDETGHANPRAAERERERRSRYGFGRSVDPLSGKDPSGSNVGTVMGWASLMLVLLVVAAVVVVQLGSGAVRHQSTAQLAQETNLQTVTAALNDGVEWGSGFTQFPEDFTVQEASEETGVVEVSVIDTAYSSETEVMASSQIQASALAINCLMNPSVSSVIYKVNVHVDDDDNIITSTFFDFLEPAGQVKPFMTFSWTKQQGENGDVVISCTITGIDAQTAERLRERIVSPNTPFLPSPTVSPQTNDPLFHYMNEAP